MPRGTPFHSLLEERVATPQTEHVSGGHALAAASPVTSVPVHPGLTCHRCALDFEDASAFRAHFRTHHHVRPDSSIESSSSSSESGEQTDYEDTALPGIAVLEDNNYDELTTTAYSALMPVLVAAGSNGSMRGAVYRALLITCGDASLAEAASIRSQRALGIPLSALCLPGEKWGVIMFQSGYFVCAVYQICPQQGVNENSSPTWPKALLHKRFARYTTRRKQGGSQSAHDASRGTTAKSVGAQLRRAGELKLQQDIAQLLADPEWSVALGSCRRLFIAAPRTAGPTLYDGRTLVRGDIRISRVPFMTGRPTLLETQRIVAALATLYDDESRGIVTMRERRAQLSAAFKSLVSHSRSESEEAATGVQERATVQWASNAEARATEAQESDDAGKVMTVATADHNDDDDDDDEDDDEDDDTETKGVEKAGSPVPLDLISGGRRIVPVATNAKARVHHGSRRQQLSRATAPGDAKVSVGPDDSFELEAAIAAAQAEADVAARMSRAADEEASLEVSVERDLARLAQALRLPAVALRRVLDWRNIAATRDTLSRGHHGKSRSAASATGADAQRQALATAHDMLSTAFVLVAEGAQPWEVCSAMGWDGLAAASLVAATGCFVDWNDLPARDSRLAGHLGSNISVSGDEMPNVVARAPSVSARHSRTKKGQKRAAKPEPLPSAVAVHSGFREPVPLPAAAPTPAPAPEEATLSQTEQRRALMRAAAERRAASAHLPGPLAAADGVGAVESPPVGPSAGAPPQSRPAADTVARTVAAIVERWVPGLR